LTQRNSTGFLGETQWQTRALPSLTSSFFRRPGRATIPSSGRWLGALSTPERIERIANAKEELYRHLVRRDGISPLPGVASWLHRLHKQGWSQAIASAAPRANIETVLEALSATHFFQGIVSAEDVHTGKPDPEVYLMAAARVGISPDRCIVVEDSVAGVEGARRAGMRRIGVSHNDNHLTADVVVQSLDLLDSDAFEKLLQKA
jgi:HAD superfamily hydrolase (TIGR01509 family)